MKNGKIIHTIMAEYKLTRDSAKRTAEETLNRALKNPEYFSVTKEISALNFTIAEKTARKADVSAENKQLETLEAKRVAVLKKMHLSDNDFAAKFNCPTCHDEGIVNGKYCKCFKEKYYATLKNLLGIETVLPLTFDNVDFSKVKDEKQREYLIKLYGIFKKYAEKFPKVNTKNALLSGGTGVGKSYLMSAVFNSLESRGFNCIYISAVQLNKLMLLYHTTSTAERDVYLDDILDCDMLIIDDLGSEQKIRNVTEEYLLQILNEREMHSKPVFITTNLSLAELKDCYNERLFSRMANRQTTIIKEILGNDLRLS